MTFVLIVLAKIIIIVVPLLISVAAFTLEERKFMASIQRRRGPNVVGVYGLTQPLADGLKLLVKETVVPSTSYSWVFILAPMISFMLSLLGWAVIPYNDTGVLAEINLGVLYIFAISSLGVYGVMMSGWASNSKYAFLGALRSAAQMISYEVSIGFIISTIAVCTGSFNLVEIVEDQETVWYVLPFSPLFVLFFVSALVETNRHPFDLPEAEAELVSGYNVEYSAMGFALFFLGEYANMLLMCALTVVLFWGGWQAPFGIDSFIPQSFWFGLKLGFFSMLFIMMRAGLPRFRYDQLMRIGWKIFFPLSLSYLVLTVCLLAVFNAFPF